VQRGRIVYLSGLTSTGKTSIIEEIGRKEGRLFCRLGFDLFEETLPPWAADDEGLYAKAILALYAAARAFSDRGLAVLIDGLVMNLEGLEDHARRLREEFAGYPLTLVGVRCPMEILRARNIARGDRRPDQSERQMQKVDPGLAYDFVLDTSQCTPEEGAEMLLKYLDRAPAREVKGE
jgi:chloramphenicol 3-O phosphotransferase